MIKTNYLLKTYCANKNTTKLIYNKATDRVLDFTVNSELSDCVFSIIFYNTEYQPILLLDNILADSDGAIYINFSDLTNLEGIYYCTILTNSFSTDSYIVEFPYENIIEIN